MRCGKFMFMNNHCYVWISPLLIPFFPLTHSLSIYLTWVVVDSSEFFISTLRPWIFPNFIPSHLFCIRSSTIKEISNCAYLQWNKKEKKMKLDENYAINFESIRLICDSACELITTLLQSMANPIIKSYNPKNSAALRNKRRER